MAPPTRWEFPEHYRDAYSHEVQRRDRDGVDDYYAELHSQRRTRDRTDDLVAAFDSGGGKTLREASLIDTTCAIRDYLVLVSSEEWTAYERYDERKTGRGVACRASGIR